MVVFVMIFDSGVSCSDCLVCVYCCVPLTCLVGLPIDFGWIERCCLFVL